MRAKLVMLSLMLLIFSGMWTSSARAAVSFDFFYSNLSPHGSWAVSAQYGRVWQPYDYSPGWNPYYDGHWVYADLGWAWVSDYPWGGIPYHYGTWVLDPVIGWVWVPGYVWAPSWVVFRTGPDYIGWAPVSPGFTVGFSTSFGARPAGPYVFVSARDFAAPRIRNCVVADSRSRSYLNHTRVVNSLVVENNVVVNRGPDVRIVERASGRRIRQARIEDLSGIGPGRTITRAQIAVDSRGARRGLRAAEPYREPSRPRKEDRSRRERPQADNDSRSKWDGGTQGKLSSRNDIRGRGETWQGRGSRPQSPREPSYSRRPSGRQGIPDNGQLRRAPDPRRGQQSADKPQKQQRRKTPPPRRPSPDHDHEHDHP